MSEPGSDNAGDLSKRQERTSPTSPPGWLAQLRDSQMRLAVLFEAIEITPDDLDAQAKDVHELIVQPVYRVMRMEVAREGASRWDSDGRRRLRESYEATADMWLPYREALAELESARQERRSAVAALRELATARREYISALRIFYDEFSGTLDFLFPIEKTDGVG